MTWNNGRWKGLFGTGWLERIGGMNRISGSNGLAKRKRTMGQKGGQGSPASLLNVMLKRRVILFREEIFNKEKQKTDEQ